MALPESDASFATIGDQACEMPNAISDRVARPKLRLIPGLYSPDQMAARELLLSSVNQSGQWYSDIAIDLNKYRDNDQKVSIVPQDELADRANDWLTDERFRVALSDGPLYKTASSPIMILALPKLPERHPVSHEEIVRTWANPRSGRLKAWAGQLAFLRQWPAEQLYGFDDEQSDEPVRFVAIETGYDINRRGYKYKQLAALKKLQISHPSIGVATLFEGSVLSRRNTATRAFELWQDMHVQAIDLNPDKSNSVPHAFVDHDGQAVVGATEWGYTGVARFKVK